MLAYYGKNTEAGIAQRSAAARAEEYWRIKHEKERQQEEELARLKSREEYQRQMLERTQAMRAELSAKIGERILPRISYAEIERRACKLFKCTRADIRSERRSRDIVFVRQFIAYWTARRTSLSLPQIGKLMSRDHTTVLHGKNRYRDIRGKMGRQLRQVR